MSVEMSMNTIPEEEVSTLCFDMIAHVPLEDVVYLKTALPILRSEEICVRMRNLIHLHLEWVDLSMWFVEPDTREPHIFKDLLPGLHSILISSCTLSGGDWSLLVNFLARRAAAGNRISSLKLNYHPRMGKGVAESIRRTVGVFEDGGSYDASDSASDGGSNDGSGGGSDGGSDDSY